MKLPKIKKSIEDYAKNEDGKISKQAIIAMGAFLGSAAIKSHLTSAHGNNHSNELSLQIINNRATGRHTHHASY
jgi:hypothetical protein